jgi:hypothetical protein
MPSESPTRSESRGVQRSDPPFRLDQCVLKRLVNDDHVHRDAEAPSRFSQTDRLSGAIIDIALDDEEVEIAPPRASPRA